MPSFVKKLHLQHNHASVIISSTKIITSQKGHEYYEIRM